MNNKRSKIIDDFARLDHITKDKKYNEGLALIRRYGYSCIYYDDTVKYYCMCNMF